ncbi:hypothetical protein N9934_05810 [Desulfosarcina sp.]|nr:hypothetical protein [Desulfosarcina sp.]
MNLIADRFDLYTVVVAEPIDRHMPQAVLRSAIEARRLKTDLEYQSGEHVWQTLPFDVWRARFVHSKPGNQ